MAYDEETLELLHRPTLNGRCEYEKMLAEKEAENIKAHPFRHALDAILNRFKRQFG